MPDARKRAVLNLAQRYDIVIFEDDIYGELATEYPRPRTIHLGISTAAKMLAAPLPKPSPPAVSADASGATTTSCQMKYAASGPTSSTQLAARNFIREGHYHRHVRRMRQIHQRNIEIYTCWPREFSCGICVTRPKGGLCCGLSSRAGRYGLRRQAAVPAEDPVAPGSLFSAAGKYRNCVRINQPCRRPRNIKR